MKLSGSAYVESIGDVLCPAGEVAADGSWLLRASRSAMPVRRAVIACRVSDMSHHISLIA